MSSVSGHTKRLVIEIGGLADPIVDQLRKQGVKIPGHMARSFERTRSAIAQLRMTNMISTAGMHRLDRKFVKLISHSLKAYGKPHHVTDEENSRG